MADVAVLLSGGLDSAVLVAQAATTGVVQPVYVSAGLAWEAEELGLVERLLQVPPYAPAVRPLIRLALDVTDLYPDTHWARTGVPPAYDTPDEDVYLPGRNILLLSKAGVLCALRGIPRLAIGPLAGNPFPDATPLFFASIAGRCRSASITGCRSRRRSSRCTRRMSSGWAHPWVCPSS